MARFHFVSLRIRLMLFALLALTPSVGMMLYNAAERRIDAKHDVQVDAQALIDRTSAESRRLLEGTHQLLAGIAQTPEVQGMRRDQCGALFRQVLSNMPQYVNFGMADLKGRVMCSALPLRPGITISDRTYFQGAIRTRSFSVGEYQISRISGKPAVNCAVPVIDANHRVRGVLFASLNLHYLSELAVGLKLPPGADFTIVDRLGTIIVRYPDAAKWVGRPAIELPQGELIQRHDSTVADFRDASGQMREYIFAPLTGDQGGLEAHVCVSVPHSVAFAAVNRVKARAMLVLVIVVLLTLLAASLGADRLVLRKVQALLDATQRVSRGDLSARTGMGGANDELGQLARAFDEMTASLQAARKDLVEAQRQRQEVYTEVIRCVTQDKFHLVEPGNVPLPGELIDELPLATGEDYSALRRRLKEVAAEAGMDPGNAAALVQATGEAVTNALKHAHDGRCQIFADGRHLFTRVSDSGPGIRAQDLAATILQPGFSTKVSLGMGYALMMELSDRVWLATGPEGTTVQLEKALKPGVVAEPGLAAAMERM